MKNIKYIQLNKGFRVIEVFIIIAAYITAYKLTINITFLNRNINDIITSGRTLYFAILPIGACCFLWWKVLHGANEGNKSGRVTIGSYIVTIIVSYILAILMLLLGSSTILNNMSSEFFIRLSIFGVTPAIISIPFGLLSLKTSTIANNEAKKIEKVEKIIDIIPKNFNYEFINDMPNDLYLIDYNNKKVKYSEEPKRIYLTNEVRYLQLNLIMQDIMENYDWEENEDGLMLKQAIPFYLFDNLVEKLNDIRKRMSIMTDGIAAINDFYEKYIKVKEKVVSIYEETIKNYNIMINELEGLQLGLDGEAIVDKELELYKRNVINLSNIRLNVDGEKIENDNILLTNRGIYILEVKNIGTKDNFTLKIEKDGRWSKIYGSKVISYEDATPVEQNNRHIAYLSKFLNDKLGKGIDDEIEVRGMIVIANDVLSIVNESVQTVVRPSEIMAVINKNPKILSEKEMLEIKELLEKSDIGAAEFEGIDYDKIEKQNLNNLVALCNDINKEIVPLKDKIEKYIEELENIESTLYN